MTTDTPTKASAKAKQARVRRSSVRVPKARATRSAPQPKSARAKRLRRPAMPSVRMPATLRTGLRWWRASGEAKPALYRLIVVTITVLALTGLVMVLSASSVASLAVYGSAWVVFLRQIAWMALAILGFAIASRIDYRIFRRYRNVLVISSLIMLVLVLIPGIGIYVSGSRRWLGFGALRFQPSEIAKIALLVFVADLVARRKGEMHRWGRVIIPAVGMFCAFAVLVIKEPDMDSTMVLAMITGAVLVVGGMRMRDIGISFAGGVALSAVLAIAEPYRRARVFSFLDPFAHADSTGYQLAQSLIAIGSGGLTGVGLGASRQKWLFLPNAHTDFIFAIIGEELGLIGCLLVVALFAALTLWGAMTAMRAPDRFGMLMAAGITTWIAGQALVNIASVVGLLPVSGIPLPFVSFGGSSLVFTMFAAGILANIARQGVRDGESAAKSSRTRRTQPRRKPVGASA